MLEKVEGTEPLRSQKSSSPRLEKRALGFSLNTKWIWTKTLNVWLVVGLYLKSIESRFDQSKLPLNQSSQSDFEILNLQLVCFWILTYNTLSYV